MFHLACLGVRHSLVAPRENAEVNVSGTLAILEAARAARVARREPAFPRREWS